MNRSFSFEESGGFRDWINHSNPATVGIELGVLDTAVEAYTNIHAYMAIGVLIVQLRGSAYPKSSAG